MFEFPAHPIPDAWSFVDVKVFVPVIMSVTVLPVIATAAPALMDTAEHSRVTVEL
jgi:hypothetical protein